MDWTYTREAPANGATEHKKAIGPMRCVIVDAKEGTNKDGIPRIEVFVRPSGCDFKVRRCILKNEKFNTNMARLFDSFPDIGDGNFNFIEWKGCLGAAEFEVDDKGYSSVMWWIYPSKAASLPEFEGDIPERQKIENPFTEEESDEEDFPF